MVQKMPSGQSLGIYFLFSFLRLCWITIPPPPLRIGFCVDVSRHKDISSKWNPLCGLLDFIELDFKGSMTMYIGFFKTLPWALYPYCVRRRCHPVSLRTQIPYFSFHVLLLYFSMVRLCFLFSHTLQQSLCKDVLVS